MIGETEMTETKIVERYRGKDYLRIELKIYQDDERGLSDGFVIVASLYEARGNRSGKSRFDAGRDCDACGILHDKIRSVAPELQPFIDVHFANLDGVPMHAIANGWYHYSGKAREWEESRGETWHNHEGLTDRERGARSLNIPAEDLPEGLDRNEFEAFAETLRPRWAEQARVARELFDSI